MIQKKQTSSRKNKGLTDLVTPNTQLESAQASLKSQVKINIPQPVSTGSIRQIGATEVISQAAGYTAETAVKQAQVEIDENQEDAQNVIEAYRQQMVAKQRAEIFKKAQLQQQQLQLQQQQRNQQSQLNFSGGIAQAAAKLTSSTGFIGGKSWKILRPFYYPLFKPLEVFFRFFSRSSR